MNRDLPRLHAVTNDAVLALPDYAARARAIAQAGPVALHVRSSTAGGRRLGEIAASMRRRCPSIECCIFVNDRADVARAVGADGVHLPSAGLTVAEARSIVGRTMWIGCSAHETAEVARAAREGADYVFLGPIWRTSSHPDRAPIGPEAISADAGIRVIAIGGVTPERVRECIQRGAYGVAIISAIWFATDAGSAAQRMLLSFHR